ncbi:MAG: NUDIX hydrolase [Cellvibrionaceae bacterium]
MSDYFKFDTSRLVPLVADIEQGQRSGHAAVLVSLVVNNGGLSLLLTRRAINMSHHGGEVAFPGGMWEPGDHFPVSTALREAEEEVSLQPHSVDVKGLLPAFSTRQGTQVTPVVGMLESIPQLTANSAEIDSIFFVPISELMADRRIRTDIFHRENLSLWSPAYEYQGHEIWGFTAGVIKMLLAYCFGLSLPRSHSAPEKFW